MQILDSTLREGMQSEGIAFSVEDKLKIAYALDNLGITFIEAGNPFSNPKDAEFFEAVLPLKHAKLTAFGSTRRKNTKVEEDANVVALLKANTPCVTIFGKSWNMHVTEVLQTTLEENLLMIKETVEFFKAQGKYVIYDAEHFFDGYAHHKEYALSTLKSAVKADVICLCDTNGGTFPEEVGSATKTVLEMLPNNIIGIHAHNDCGMAVASSMQAVKNGAKHVQGTLIGYGERCGNAPLSTIIPNLELKLNIATVGKEKLALLTDICRGVADVSNIILPYHSPYVGSSAFAHKGGMHIDGVKKVKESFEHINPKTVGNSRKFLVSEVSGKSVLLKKIQKIDKSATAKSAVVSEAVARLKELEMEGYQFEAAEESLELVILRLLNKHKSYFDLDYYKIIGEHPLTNTDYPSTAVVKIRVGGTPCITGAEGNGPVHALDLALRKALINFYPTLKDMSLKDYKVRVLESDATTAAKVRVLIVSTDKNNMWSTVGVSTDIIEASFLALTDSIEYKLISEENKTKWE